VAEEAWDQASCPVWPTDAAGDAPDARLRRALDRWFDLVWRTLRGLGVPDAQVDDATQLVFLTFSQKLARVPPAQERAFLVATAVRIAANDRRVRRRRPEDPSDSCDESPSAVPDPERQLATKQALGELEAILARMSHELRTVFLLFELEGFRMSEIADMLALPPGTVASRLRSARQVFGRAVAELRAADSEREVRR
jgi:RNA polymerase sigma-70 factor (ECF subfamily)